MAYEDRRSGFDSLAVVILFVLLLAVVVLGMGGFIFYSRKQSMVAMDRAMAAEAAAIRTREEAEQQRLLAEAELAKQGGNAESDSEGAESDALPVTIAIDAAGTVSVGGDEVDADKLQQRLEALSSETFVVEVDNDCRLKRVADLLSLFDELGMDRPRIAITQ